MCYVKCHFLKNKALLTINMQLLIPFSNCNGTKLYTLLLCAYKYFVGSLFENDFNSSNMSCSIPPEMKEWNESIDRSYEVSQYRKSITCLEEEKETLLIEIECLKKLLKLSNDRKGKGSLVRTLQDEIKTLTMKNKVRNY